MDGERNGRRALLNQPGNDYGGTTPCTLSNATLDTSPTSAFGGLYAILKKTHPIKTPSYPHRSPCQVANNTGMVPQLPRMVSHYIRDHIV